MNASCEKMSNCDFDKQSNDSLKVEEPHLPKEFWQFLPKFDIYEKLEIIQKLFEERPLVGLFIVISLTLSVVPMVTFFVFVVASMVFTALGFLLFEGTVLIIGTFILAGILFIVVLFSSGLTVFLLFGCYITQMVLNIITIVKESFKNKQQ